MAISLLHTCDMVIFRLQWRFTIEELVSTMIQHCSHCNTMLTCMYYTFSNSTFFRWRMYLNLLVTSEPRTPSIHRHNDTIECSRLEQLPPLTEDIVILNLKEDHELTYTHITQYFTHAVRPRSACPRIDGLCNASAKGKVAFS